MFAAEVAICLDLPQPAKVVVVVGLAALRSAVGESQSASAFSSQPKSWWSCGRPLWAVAAQAEAVVVVRTAAASSRGKRPKSWWLSGRP